MLCGLLTVQQASVLDGLSLDPFAFDEDGRTSPEVDVGWCQVGEALVVAPVIVGFDEGLDLLTLPPLCPRS
jgi:hypothetical protein